MNHTDSDSVLLKSLELYDAAQNIAEQTKYLKQVGTNLKKAAADDAVIQTVCNTLTSKYYSANPKDQIKRAIASCIQSQDEEKKSIFVTVLSDKLRANLDQFENSSETKVTSPKVLTLTETEDDTDDEGMDKQSASVLVWSKRQAVDVISGLLENFVVGEKCLESVCQIVLEFLLTTLKAFEQEIWQTGSAVERVSKMHDCHVTTQVLNKFMQKTSSVVVTLSTQLHSSLMECVCKPLYDEQNLLDWRSASAMSGILLMKLVEGPQVITKVLSYIFPSHAPADMVTVASPSALDAGLPRLCLSALSLSSGVCVLNAVLAMLPVSVLAAEYCWGDTLMLGVIATQLMEITAKLTDGNSKLMASRTLLLFTTRAKECVQIVEPHKKKENILCMGLQGTASVPQALIQYAWNHWEDTVDPLRYQAQQVFENVIHCHLEATGQDKDQAQSDPFLGDLISSLLSLSWYTRGKYRPLACMVKILGASYFLRKEPRLTDLMLQMISDQTLACYVSELYEVLFCSHLDELGEKLDAWQEAWVTPLLQILTQASHMHRKHSIEYIVPKILKKSPESLRFITTSLSQKSTGSANLRLGALITCLKRSRLQGSSFSTSDSENLWNGAVPINVLKQALCHTDDQIRLDAFGLLCEHPKTTAAITDLDLSLLCLSLPYNLDSQSPAFRQYVTSFLKKLFIRLRESGQLFSRQYAQNKKQNKDVTQAEAILISYKKFQEWLVGALFGCLVPGASFPRRTTAVSSLAMMLHILGTEPQKDLSGLLFSLAASITPARVQSLLECFTDTFEHNKQDAYTLLTALPLERLQEKVGSHLSPLLSAGLSLSRSTRPQDCTTAAYLLRLLSQQPQLHPLLLCTHAEDIVINQHGEDIMITAEGSEQEDIMASPKEDIMNINHKDKNSAADGSNMPILDDSFWNSITNDGSGRCLLLLRVLLKEVKAELKTARSNLLHAAATSPMYPALHVMRYLLADVDMKSVEGSIGWRHLLAELITTCFSVAEVVGPVVNNSSPEGNVPEEAIASAGSTNADEDVMAAGDEDDEEELSAARVRLMPEYLVVCCWRSIKEVSLLLGEVTATAAPTGQHGQGGLISTQQLDAIGDYFIHQLLDSRHRGAFELAYAGFVKMADMLWNPVSIIHQLPSVWLSAIMEDIRCDNGRLCATRRSAGLPFYMQALVSTEPPLSGRPNFHAVMKELLQLARPENMDKDNTENEAQVHALNVLRALFRDTRLAEDVFPYVADAMMSSVLGYGSKFWALRNSASLLFSALMTRIFGVQRAKEEISKKNCLTGRVFFNRFPSLFDFLLEQLKQATENMQDGSGEFHLHPGLYPVLMLLGRLFPSVVDTADLSLVNLAAFIPYVIRCGSSAVHKTRVMSARALSPLVAKPDTKDVLLRLLRVLPTQPGNTVPQNKIHGTLLQINSLLENDELSTCVIDDIQRAIIPCLLQYQWLGTRANQCLPTRLAFLQAANQLLCYKSSSDCKETSHWSELFILITSQADKELSELSPDILAQPAAAEFYQNLAKIYLNLLEKETVENKLSAWKSRLLRSPIYEVRLQVLDSFVEVIDTGGTLSHDSKNLEDTNSESQCVFDDDVLKELLSMGGGKEKHPECLAQVLHVLNHLPTAASSLNLPWSNNNSGDMQQQQQQQQRQQMVDRLLTLADHPLLEVQSEALGLMGKMLPGLVQTATNKENAALESLGRVVRWLEGASHTEQAIPHRHQAAKVILDNAQLLLSPRDDNIIDGSTVWTCVVRLLQDEDVVVREVAACVPARLQHGPKQHEWHDGENAVPCLALEMCVSAIVTDLDRLDLTLQWINEDLEQDWEQNQEKEVRLFDKGEMNTYRDQLYFVQMVAEQASKRMKPQNPTQEKSKSLSQLLETNLEELNKSLDTGKSYAAQDPFTNQWDYQEDIINLTRKLYCCKVLSKLVKESEKSDLVQEKLKEINVKVKSRFQCLNVCIEHSLG